MVKLPATSPFFYRLFDHLIEGIIVLDSTGTILYSNSRAHKMFNEDEQPQQGKFIGDFFQKLVTTDESKQHIPIDFVQHIAQQREIPISTVSYQTAKGVAGTMALSLFALKPNEPSSPWVCSFVDVSESLRDKLDRTRFVRVIGHELKHPLSSLKAYLYMLRKRITDSSPKTVEYMHQAEDQIDILTAMLNDLTDISKISLQQFDVEPERQLVRPILTQVINDFYVTHPQRKIEMQLSNSRLKALIDPIRFRQVLHNILSNAARYSDPSTPIMVRVSKIDQMVTITVTDQGIGISTEDIANVFDPYFRTKQGYQYKGLGLGLYIAREIMHRHKGKISITSSSGKGTTVTLWFPT